ENGARLYLDVGSHPEYATPECDSVTELVTHDKAGERIPGSLLPAPAAAPPGAARGAGLAPHDRRGERILESLLAAAEARLHEEGIAGKIFLFKNNTDSAGNSYGCHANYPVCRCGECARP